jgi:hypothetical protein
MRFIAIAPYLGQGHFNVELGVRRQVSAGITAPFSPRHALTPAPAHHIHTPTLTHRRSAFSAFTSFCILHLRYGN